MTAPVENARDVDVVIVEAGFAGLYLLHRCRQAGLSAVTFDVADDVGGTWYWNRYPGARCDVPTTDYSFSFDPDLDKEWTWSEKYATQPDILRYLQFIAARYDLRREYRTDVRRSRALGRKGAALASANGSWQRSGRLSLRDGEWLPLDAQGARDRGRP